MQSLRAARMGSEQQGDDGGGMGILAGGGASPDSSVMSA